MDSHLKTFNLMERQQRGDRVGCSGTKDNLLIDRMVTLDCHRGKRNLSMSWVDVRKSMIRSTIPGWLKSRGFIAFVSGYVGRLVISLLAGIPRLLLSRSRDLRFPVRSGLSRGYLKATPYVRASLPCA